MKMTHLPLNVKCTDSFTGSEGILTHMVISSNLQLNYFFQPARLNPKTKSPCEAFLVTGDRVSKELKNVHIDYPTEVLGSNVTCKNTGFSGIATSLCVHINGCVHVQVQAAGTTDEGAAIPVQDFDIRQLRGEKIKEMTTEELEKSRKEKPSPGPKVKLNFKV